ncbi:MAG: glucosyltransferase domain-containing protein [Lachnospiraceae bacterium]|nr:glucosyltransferase domain-containing protein [Lachnospiraceae bacterium]
MNKQQTQLYTWMKSSLSYVIFAVLAGVIVYFSLMSNDLVNHLDGIWHPSNFIAGDWEISLGRGLQRYADRARFGLVSSAWNSVLVFLLLGIADYVVIDRFQLKHTVYAYLLIFATIANPVVCEAITYSYMSVNFALAYFFAVSAFAVAAGELHSVRGNILQLLCGAVLFGISMAFYQAYICVFAVLAGYWLMKELTLKMTKEVLQRLGYFAGTFLLGGLIYLLITKLLLLRAGIEMASYRGASGISLLSVIMNLPTSIVTACKETYRYAVNQNLSMGLEFSSIVITLLLIGMAALFLRHAIRLFRESVSKGICFVILILLLPLMASIVCVIAVGSSITGLMAMGILMSVLLAGVLADQHRAETIGTIALLTVLSWYLVSTVENDQIALKEGTVATNQIADNALAAMSEEGLLTQADCVAFVGRAAENPYFYKSTAYEMANDYAQFGRWSTDARNNRVTWNGILTTLCGIQLTFCDDETYTALIQSETIAEMPCYPAEGYLEIVDGVLVVKISELY